MGEPPAVEITITNMNDNVDENFLRNLLQKCGPTEEQTIYRHQRTQRRLGIARIVFIDVKSARNCIERYNQQSVMGNVMNVFHDSFGEQCKQLLLDASGDKKSQKPNQPQAQPQQQQQPPPPPVPSQLHAPAIPPPVLQQPMPPFKPKDELMPTHLSESDPYYNQMDYNNPYARDHKPPPSNENDSFSSRDKYDDYGYDSTDHRHYRSYDKKDSRRWDYDSKSSRYHKDKDRRSDRYSYKDRNYRDDGRGDSSSGSSSRRRDYDYDRKDRRDPHRSSRDPPSKYRDYKKSDRDYMPPIDNSYSAHASSTNVYAATSHHHSSHHYASFDNSSSSSSFHQYPPLPWVHLPFVTNQLGLWMNFFRFLFHEQSVSTATAASRSMAKSPGSKTTARARLGWSNWNTKRARKTLKGNECLPFLCICES